MDVSGSNGYSFGITGSSQSLVFKAAANFAAATLFTMDRSGNFTASADVTAYSDTRLKKNIQRIQGASEKVVKLNGYTYQRSDTPDDERTHIGLLAQEVLEVLPEVVHLGEDGVYSVSYGNIVALLIEALKEEVSKRKALEEKVDEYIRCQQHSPAA